MYKGTSMKMKQEASQKLHNLQMNIQCGVFSGLFFLLCYQHKSTAKVSESGVFVALLTL